MPSGPNAPVPFVNPLAGLSFDDSIDPGKFLAKIESNVRERMVEHARLSKGDAFASAIQTVALTQNGYYVTFSNMSYGLMKSGGGLKGVQIDAAGKVHELPTVSEFGSWANSLSKITSLVVSVAHIISGADVSRRLGKVESSLARLDAKIEIGQRADLYSAYKELRDRLGEARPDSSALRSLRDRFRTHRVRYVEEAKASVGILAPLRSTPSVEPPALLKGAPRSVLEAVGGPLGKAVVKGTDLAAKGYKLSTSKIEEMRTVEGRALHTQRLHELNEIAGRIGMAEYCLRLESLVSGVLESDYSENCRDLSKTLRGMVNPLAVLEQGAGLTEDRANAVEDLANAMARVGRPE